MPATIAAPSDTGTDFFGDLIGSDQNAPDYGAFGDLVPKDSQFDLGTKQAGADLGPFSDLVPQSPTSETEKAVAQTPDPEKMSDLERLVLGLGPKKSADTSVFHQTLNAVRSLAAGAGKFIYEGLQALKDTQAQYLEDTATSAEQRADYLKLPDGSALSKEQQVELEKKYHDTAIADIPDAKAQADLFKQLAANADTALYVDPALANTIPARIAHTAGQASVMALESLLPRIGVPLMVYHGALATQSEYQKAHPDAPYSEAEDAGTRSAIGLALFGGASKVAALGVAKLLPEGAAPLTKFISQFTGQATANETSSRAINAWESANEAEPGKKIEAALNALKDTTLEQSTLNMVYALAHATKAAGKEPVTPVSTSEPQPAPGIPEAQPATTSEPIQQAPMSEVLRSEPQPQKEQNAIQIGSTAPEVPRPTERGQNQPSSSEGMGPSEQGPETAGTSQTPQEPIGVADAIAEIQRRNAPEPASITERVSDDPFVSRIANRFTEERAKTGQIGEIAPGQGYATSDLVQRGLKMAPEEINQHVSDIMNDAGGNPIKQAAAIRAEEARLSDRSTELSRVAEANPQDLTARQAANSAFQDLTDFHNGPVAKLKERFHATGMALQGEIPVDLSTVNGLREKWLKDNGVAPPASMESTFSRTAENVRRATTEEKLATDKLGQEIEKATKGRKLPTADEVRSRIAERMKDLPCRV